MPEQAASSLVTRLLALRATRAWKHTDYISETRADLIALCFFLTNSQEEMALNIVGLLHQSMADMAMTRPIWADFTGGMDKVEGLDRAMADMRKVRVFVCFVCCKLCRPARLFLW